MGHLEFCRICTKLTQLAKSNKLFETSQRKLIKQIKEITGILLENSKQLPQYICKPCEDDLEKAYEFRERCIYAQEYFSTVEHREEMCNSEKSGPIKQFDIKDELPMDENHVSEICYVKDETSDILQCDEQQIVEHSFIEEKSTHALDSNDTDDALYVPKELPTSTIKTRLKTKTHLGEIKEGNLAQDKREKKINRMRKNLNRDEKIQTFICDQCGNNFTCKHHFITHLRRHTGDKQFQCELCPDKFFTHSELNRHMRKHTGERPFACKHCGRRFTDYSTRIKHERTHTNERPFACTQCSKAFTTSYILKNHMLVHTGERSFKCDLCNKAFQRQTHLVVHYKSIMHKQNEEKHQKCGSSSTNLIEKSNFEHNVKCE